MKKGSLIHNAMQLLYEFVGTAEEQEEILLPLCLTGFCYAEAGKNNDATHLKLTLESLIHVTTLFIVRTIFIHQPPL